MEKWKEIPGYEGFYSVSNLGRVRAEERQVPGKCGSIRTLPQKIMNPSNTDGYVQVSLHKEKSRFCKKVHVLVMLAFSGPRPMGMEVAHNNGVRNDNRIENLRYDTKLGNCADKKTHGTQPRGSQISRSKLSKEQVIAIRADSRKFREIGREYGVHHKSISNIKNEKNWSWL
jgi:hypothetical protein